MFGTATEGCLRLVLAIKCYYGGRLVYCLRMIAVEVCECESPVRSRWTYAGSLGLNHSVPTWVDLGFGLKLNAIVCDTIKESYYVVCKIASCTLSLHVILYGDIRVIWGAVHRLTRASQERYLYWYARLNSWKDKE